MPSMAIGRAIEYEQYMAASPHSRDLGRPQYLWYSSRGTVSIIAVIEFE